MPAPKISYTIYPPRGGSNSPTVGMSFPPTPSCSEEDVLELIHQLYAIRFQMNPDARAEISRTLAEIIAENEASDSE